VVLSGRLATGSAPDDLSEIGTKDFAARVAPAGFFQDRFAIDPRIASNHFNQQIVREMGPPGRYDTVRNDR